MGLGGIAPGLSGTVLLLIFGLYQETLDALGNLFRNFRKNAAFLLPLVAGMFCGVLLFSRIIDFLLNGFEIPTRFCFLGLILGTVPMVWQEVKREGFSKKYYGLIIISFLTGTCLFTLNPNSFPQITHPNLLQSIALGVAVAATAIIPGVDPAVVLSTLGFYEMYVGALAEFSLPILLPMLIGLAVGALGISAAMSLLFKRWHTGTFSVIFGMFLSMIPNILSDSCVLTWNLRSMVSIALMVLGFAVSFYLGDMERCNTKLKQLLKKQRGS